MNTNELLIQIDRVDISASERLSALRALKDYEKQKKAGINPVFRAEDIDLPHEVDYWD